MDRLDVKEETHASDDGKFRFVDESVMDPEVGNEGVLVEKSTPDPVIEEEKRSQSSVGDTEGKQRELRQGRGDSGESACSWNNETDEINAIYRREDDRDRGGPEAIPEDHRHDGQEAHYEGDVDRAAEYGDDDRSSKQSGRGRARGSLSLLVRNLHKRTNIATLRSVFEQYGEIRDVYMPQDYMTRRSRGFGFVEFLNAEDGKVSMNDMQGKIVDGNTIEIVEAQIGRRTPEQMRNREGRRKPQRRSRTPHGDGRFSAIEHTHSRAGERDRRWEKPNRNVERYDDERHGGGDRYGGGGGQRHNGRNSGSMRHEREEDDRYRDAQRRPRIDHPQRTGGDNYKFRGEQIGRRRHHDAHEDREIQNRPQYY